MIATFENTVGILVKAYLEGTLLKGDCWACAVGNICAAATGNKVIMSADGLKWSDADSTPSWANIFITSEGKQSIHWTYASVPEFIPKPDYHQGWRQIEQTGYTMPQLARIEYAFETTVQEETAEAQFAGLMAVVDVLADIHGIDLATTEASKLLFVKA